MEGQALFIIHWITPVTPINLTAQDNAYGSGLQDTWYRVYYPNDTLYTIPVYDTWTSYQGNFTIEGPEGVYRIYYYSQDHVGNLEDMHNQTAIQGCPWDLNDDHGMNILDVIIVVNHLGEMGEPWWIPMDLAGSPQGLPDGEINILDIISIANHWGTCP